MTQLINNINKEYIYSTNDIDYNYYEENLQTINFIDDLNQSIVYLPVHNINDIYEWYRIFKDSYIYTNNKDKYGFAIHAYFDKSRGESIKGWFPNLVEVKASSTETLKYYNDDNNYYKSSEDFITNFNDLETLFIDNVEIHENEKILLKNQYYETLNMFLIDTIYSTYNEIYIEITDNENMYFEINNILIMKNNENIFIENKILNLSYTTISSIDYLIIKLQDNIIVSNIISVGDKIKGMYLMNTLQTENGVYEYKNNQLVLCDFMYDKYKMYNQIIYTYQGLTNTNKEFYLRRNEIKFDSNYTKFPISGISNPLYYSEGSAYLVKCELSYNTTTTSGTLLVPTCCGCQNIDTSIEHPTGPGPHNYTTDPFRLLYTDYNETDKIFLSGTTGPAKYVFNSNISLGSCDQKYTFYNKDEDNNDNVIKKYFDLFFNNSLITLDNISFKYVNYSAGETLNPIITNTNYTYTQLTNTTLINYEYDLVQDILPTSLTIEDGSLINLKITDNISNTLILNMTFQISNLSITTSDLEFEIFPKLDENLFNHVNLLTNYSIDINFLSVYGSISGDADDNINSLKNKINSTILGKIYNFSFDYNTFLLNNINQNNILIYENPKFILDVEDIVTETFYLNHELSSDITIYNKDYTIKKYLNDYLDVNANSYIVDILSYTFTGLNDKNDPNYFEIIESEKIPNRGNIIKFGKNFKELIFDIIVTKDTYLYLDFLDLISSYTIFNVWVNNYGYNSDTEIGYIELLEYIPILNNGEELVIEQGNDINIYSNIYKNIFEKVTSGKITTDELHTHQIFDVYNPLQSFSPYNINTAKTAYISLNENSIVSKISGVVFKEYNEPRISFTKRDKSFKFSDDEIIITKVCTVTNINILSAPSIINDYTLFIDDLIIVKDQIDNTENGIYIFNGSGNELIRYNDLNKKNYWYTEYGTVSSNKYFTIYYEIPLLYGTSPINFYESIYRRKSDPRLSLIPIEIAKLGVDNKTQPFKKINTKYDLSELEEDLINIQIGINNINKIKFIDGLTEYNILNNINGQGQYSWILNEDVITENAIVGCTKEFGTGTGDLIWYTGTWVQGGWCNGIWIQGHWITGIWYNGIFNANDIQNNNIFITYNPIQINTLSTWDSGIWINGTFNGGIVITIQWYNGIFNNGVIYTGLWENGTFNGGIIRNIHWKYGLFTGGDFETGVWENGILNQLSVTNPARFGINSKVTSDFNDRAIWRTGKFIGGEFYSDPDKFNSSIFYNGLFENAKFYGGSFIYGKFKNSTWTNGVWFGGYKCTIENTINTTVKKITIIPTQYDQILGLNTNFNYKPNLNHNVHLENSSFYFLAICNNEPFNYTAFINSGFLNGNTPYVTKPYINGTASDTELNVYLDGSVDDTTYQSEDTINNIPDGNPILASEFTGNWKAGLWLNGLFISGSFETGVFSQGHVINGTFGLI